MKNKKGFTLIEILAVIVILGILMVIAIPNITGYITDSRREAYVDTAKAYVDAARRAVASGEFTINDPDTTYYIHINNIEMESGEKQSPYGEFEDAYVVVTYEENVDEPYQYYWVSKDVYGNRFDLTRIDKLNPDDMYNNVKRPINNKAPVGIRNKIKIIDNEGNHVKASQAIELTREEADRCYSYEFIESNKTVKITYYNIECGTEVMIPGIIDGYTLNEIYSYTFYNMGLTSVIIPGTVTKIGSRAFGSNQLTKVTLPEGLITIDSEAFMSNKLPSIYLPDGLKTIGARAFRTNLMEDYDIPNSVTSLGACAFCNNPITNASFLYVRKDNGEYDYSRIKGYIGDLSEFSNKKFVIPATSHGVALKTIEGSAFYNMGLSGWEVVIPDTVETIGSDAFNANGIAKVNFPSSLKTIGSSAFYSNNLTTLTIPSSVTSIGGLAFNCNQVTSGDDLWIYKRTASGIDYSTLIGYSGAARNNITIPAESHGVALKTIAGSALRYLSLTGGITIPSSVSSIGELAFALNNLTWVDNGDGDKTYPFVYKRTGAGTFDKTSLLQYASYNKANVVIPDYIKRIENYAFYYSRIRGVTIPEGVTYIGKYAFHICDLRGTVTIPSTVTTIGDYAFLKQKTWTCMNCKMTTILNKTGREFNWKVITNGPEAATFVTGNVKNWYGDILVTDR